MRGLWRLWAVALMAAGCRSSGTTEGAAVDTTQWTMAERGQLAGRAFTVWADGPTRCVQLDADNESTELAAWMGAWTTEFGRVIDPAIDSSVFAELELKGGAYQVKVHRGLTTVELLGSEASVLSALSQIKARLGAPEIVVGVGPWDARSSLVNWRLGEVRTTSVARPNSSWGASINGLEEAMLVELSAELMGQMLTNPKGPLLANEAVVIDSFSAGTQSELHLELYSTEGSTRSESMARKALRQISDGEVSSAAFEAAREILSARFRSRMTQDGELGRQIVQAIILGAPLESLNEADQTISNIDVSAVRGFARRWTAR